MLLNILHNTKPYTTPAAVERERERERKSEVNTFYFINFQGTTPPYPPQGGKTKKEVLMPK